MKDKFNELETGLAERLRKLPEVQADKAFTADLRQRLLAGHARNARQKRPGGLGVSLRYGSVAAALVVLLAGWLAFFNPGKDSEIKAVGPLFMAQAQASSTAVPQITLGSGVDSLRQVEFKMQGTVPAGAGDGYVFKLKHGEITAEQALELARLLGISNAKVMEDGSAIPENRHIYITGSNGDLVIWPQGSWQYSRRQDGAAGAGKLSPKEMETAALEWLTAAGLLPQEKFAVENKPLEHGAEIFIRLEAAPDGSPLAGFVPEIRIVVRSDGKVAESYGTWYSEEQAVKVQLADYNEALEALKLGEGVFEAKNYRHYQPGTATVQNVRTAYQLCFAIDYTPYLVPVAVFSGEYQPEGEPADKFTALVSLLKYSPRPNSGNFALAAQFPKAPAALPTLLERGVEASREELPQLAAFFKIEGKPAEDGAIRDAKGEISATSWDGGWLYRKNVQGQVRNANSIARDKALETAGRLVEQIPVLPGAPGQPIVKDDGSGFSLVVFPLLYGGVPVTNHEPPGFASYIAVQVGPDGEVWSVNCARPMKEVSGAKPLLTPEQAWEQLLANQSRVHVTGFFGSMPGDRFVAASSSITGFELAYIPRHPELMRNEYYEMVYVFKGKARVGERQVDFTAYVNAVKQ